PRSVARVTGAGGLAVCNLCSTSLNSPPDRGEPLPGMAIDRNNNNGDYDPGNCNWSSRTEQARNRRPYKKRKARRAKLEEIRRFADSMARAASVRAAP